MLKEEMGALRRAIIQNPAASTENVQVQEERVEEMIQLIDLAEKWGFELSKEEPQDLMGEILAECVGSLEACWWGEWCRKKTTLP